MWGCLVVGVGRGGLVGLLVGLGLGVGRGLGRGLCLGLGLVDVVVELAGFRLFLGCFWFVGVVCVIIVCFLIV
jgi:hypothetical protein